VKNSIAILAVLNCFGFLAQNSYFSRKDTLIFAPDSSYARSVVRDGNNLLFGTSRNGVVQLNEKTGELRTLILESPSGEFRSVITTGNTTIGMVAGDNGEIWSTTATRPFLAVDKKTLFFDDMDRYGNSVAVLGDPVNGEFSLFLFDLSAGKLQTLNAPKSIKDEACYAASGTTVLHPSASTILFISGGSNAARFHRTDDLGKTWTSVDLPMRQGEGCGPFSIHFTDREHALIVGGCYTSPNEGTKTSLYSTDGGKSWNVSETATRGYRSCVTGNRKRQFACGTNGIDISTDGGKNWKAFDSGNYCALLLEKKTLYATTNKGKCVRYRLN